jgi:hypothetical protein
MRPAAWISARAFAQDLLARPAPARVCIEDCSRCAPAWSPRRSATGDWVSSRNWVRYVPRRSPTSRGPHALRYRQRPPPALTRADRHEPLAYARTKLMRPLGIELAPRARRASTSAVTKWRCGRDCSGRRAAEQRAVRGRRSCQRGSKSWLAHDVAFQQPRPRKTAGGNASAAGTTCTSLATAGNICSSYPPRQPWSTSDAVSPREGDHNRALHDLLTDYLIPAAERGR